MTSSNDIFWSAQRRALKTLGGVQELANGDGMLARFEEGVSADPTENMSPEDAAEWKKQTEEHKDEFKKSANRMRLSPKEIARGSEGWTIVVRPQASGGYMVAAVHIETGNTNGKPQYVDDKSGIPAAVKRETRMLSKMGLGGNMADTSRFRYADIDQIDRSEAMIPTLGAAMMPSLSEALADLGKDPKAAQEDVDEALEDIGQLARFEEGKPADPTENMNPEDAKEWKKQTEEHKDEFKKSALNADLNDLGKLAEGCPDNLDDAECKEWEANTEKYKDVVKDQHKSAADQVLDEMERLAKFEEGKSVDVPKYLEDHGNPEAAKAWEDMNEEHKDNFKTAADVPKAVYEWFVENDEDIDDWNLKDLKQTLSKKFRASLAQAQQILDLREKWKRNELNNGEFKEAVKDILAKKKTASDVGQIIIQQMGGGGRLKAMLGVNYLKFLPDGVEFAWPNKTRSKGNLVKITLEPSDTYKVEFFNSAGGARKLVKSYDDIYAESLIELFERQTGWRVRLASARKRLTASGTKEGGEYVNLWAAVFAGKSLVGVTDEPTGKNPSFWDHKAAGRTVDIVPLKHVPLALAQNLADQGTEAQVFPNGIVAWKMANRYAPKESRLASEESEESEEASMDKTAGKPAGLYGFTKRVQSDCEASTRKLQKAASKLARESYHKDNEVASFLSTHMKRANSLPAKILVEAMKEIGPKIASSEKTAEYSWERAERFKGKPAGIEAARASLASLALRREFNEPLEKYLQRNPQDKKLYDAAVGYLKSQGVHKAGEKTAEWKGWDEEMPVQVVTAKGAEVFQNLADAKKHYPELNPAKNTKHFTWATKGSVAGKPAIRFESPAVNKQMSLAASEEGLEKTLVEEGDPRPKEASKSDWGLYGFKARTANLGLHACTALRESAGHIASGLHGRKSDSHGHITGFLKAHAKEAGCLYSRMLHAGYPDADRRCASASVQDWISWEE